MNVDKTIHIYVSCDWDIRVILNLSKFSVKLVTNLLDSSSLEVIFKVVSEMEQFFLEQLHLMQ